MKSLRMYASPRRWVGVLALFSDRKSRFVMLYDS